MKTTPYALRCAAIASLGGLLFGFDTAVISGTVKSLESIFLLDKWWLGFTVAFALFGTILGSATAQIPSNKFGRKPTLIVMALLFLFASIGTAYPEIITFGQGYPADWYSFMFFRFLGGIAVGAASVVSPLYSAEISPARSRGLLVGFTQFNIVFGILLAFFSNYAIAQMGFGENAWRYMFGVMAIPAGVFFLLLFISPESPRWLVTNGYTDKAKAVLERLGTDGSSPEEEVAIIQKALEEEQQTGVKEKFFCHRYRWPIFLAICIAAFNQLSGINAILYYAPTIFEMAGASESMSMFLPVIIGLTNLIVTMAALAVVDKFGRRTLLFVGSIGYITSMAIVATTFTAYAPQFHVSTANFAIKGAEEKVEQYKDSVAKADGETKSFWEGEYKGALADLLLAIEDAQLAAKRVAGEKVSERTNEEKDARRKELLKVESNTLTSDIETAIGQVDRNPTVPMTGILIVLGGLMLFIASHAFGNGACIWTFVGEIFPNRVRAQGQALGSFTHWVLCAVVSQLFPPLLALLGPSTIFYGFSGLMVLQLLWTIFLMPETKQVSLEDMQKKLGIT